MSWLDPYVEVRNRRQEAAAAARAASFKGAGEEKTGPEYLWKQKATEYDRLIGLEYARVTPMVVALLDAVGDRQWGKLLGRFRKNYTCVTYPQDLTWAVWRRARLDAFPYAPSGAVWTVRLSSSPARRVYVYTGDAGLDFFFVVEAAGDRGVAPADPDDGRYEYLPTRIRTRDTSEVELMQALGCALVEGPMP